VSKETCIRKVLYNLDAEAIENVTARWMDGLDEGELRSIAINGSDTAITWLTRKYNPIKR